MTISTLTPGPLEDLSHQAWFFNRQQPTQTCSYTSCQTCGGRPPHNYQIRNSERLSPGTFERKLKEIIPIRLSIVGLNKDLFSQLLAEAAHLKVDVKTDDWELITDAILAATSNVEFHFTFPQKASYMGCHF
jgi:hypothetical protein